MANDQVKVDFVGDASGVKAAGAQAEQAVENVGKKGGKAADGFAASARAARLFQAAIRYIAFPAVILSTAERVAKHLLEWTDRARTLREEVKAVGAAFQEAATQAQRAARGDPGKRAEQAEDDAKERQRAIEELDKIEKKALDEEADRLRRELNATNVAFRGQAEAGRRARIQAINESERNEKSIREDYEKRRRAILEGSKKVEEARQQLTEKPLLRELAAARASLETDPRLKLDAEYEQRKAELSERFKGESNQRLLQLEQELLDTIVKMHKKAVDEITHDTLKQYSEMLEEIRQQQTAGFTLGDLDLSRSGSGTALSLFGQQLVTAVRLHGSGM